MCPPVAALPRLSPRVKQLARLCRSRQLDSLHHFLQELDLVLCAALGRLQLLFTLCSTLSAYRKKGRKHSGRSQSS